MAYRHNDALYKHKVRAHRFRKAAIVSVFLVTIVALGISIDWVMNKLGNEGTVVSKATTTSVQSANVSVYRTSYFQFQAPDEWVAVAGESSDKRFVYVKNNGYLITQRLVIYVDRPAQNYEADFKATHTLPVEVSELGNFINIGEVSSHCDDSWPEGLQRNPSRIVHNKVSFVCSTGSDQYNIVVGEYNGNEEIEFTLRDGRSASYTIIYSDLTAYPSSGDLYNIVSSFSTL